MKINMLLQVRVRAQNMQNLRFYLILFLEYLCYEYG